MMHWYGEIDANEVEFVPAPSSPPPPSSSSSSFSSGPSPVINNILGPHVMRTLDFDCRRKMSIDENGIEQAVTAFFRNDPFYPRPGPGGRGGGEEGSSQPLSLSLWTAFQDRYLQTSDATIRSSSSSQVQDVDARIRLSRFFIERIEETGARKDLKVLGDKYLSVGEKAR